MPHSRKNDVIAFLRDSKERFATRYGVRRIGLLGSVARDRAAAGTADGQRVLEYGVDGLQIDSIYENAAKHGLRPR